jgi:Bacterial regulatory proteins, tetR family
VPTNKTREGILNKKQNIIQAAAHLFAEHGFEGTTTLRTAREAGVTEPLHPLPLQGQRRNIQPHIRNLIQRVFFQTRNPGKRNRDPVNRIAIPLALYGTVLGVFTLIALHKDSIKEIFAQPL